MAHLTLQEVVDRINQNYSYYSKRKLRSTRKPAESRPHHPEYYVPRITRFFAGLMFGAFRASGSTTVVQKANGRYSAPPQKLVPLVAEKA
jgi:hypothetical protein